MMLIKKILSCVLITTILLSLSIRIFAAGTTASDISTMAAALNKLGILQGSNGNFHLNDKTTRTEAAALIIRMLGKANYVIQNTEQLKNTKYPDVPSKEWYAPYVGYCTQYNIMVGNPDGKFSPNQNINEKAFLKMALCALGYVYNTDFDWSNVYQKAYLAGIVTDPAYAAKAQDNNNYLRSDAVQVLYNSLNAMKKGTSTKMVFTLVNEGAFARDVIDTSGILGLDKATEIDITTATGFSSIEVNLNESIQSINAADITITDSTSTTTSAITTGGLTVLSAAVANDKIQIITSGQTPNKNYTIKINSVTDINGNISGPLTGTFKGFVRQEVASDYFRISKIEQISANVINVYFTHPVNNNSETASYYEFAKNGNTLITGSTQNITVKKLPSVGNAVSIYLKNTILTQGEVYNLKLSGKLTSSYGVRLNEGNGETVDFVATVASTGQLNVLSIEAQTNSSVKIVFSRDVDTSWAEKFLNYTVYDASKNMISVTRAAKSGVGDTGDRTIILSLAAPLDKTKQYEVKIEYIPDIYKQSSIEGSFKFSGAYPENNDLGVKQTVSEYSNCVVLLFNKALDKSFATNTTNYLIKGITDGSFSTAPAKVYYEDTYGDIMVKLYLPSDKYFSSTQKYAIYITGLKDSAGGLQPPVIRVEFNGSSYSAVKPQIVDAVTISKDAVKLMFSPEIAFDLNNLNTSNYTLEYTENGETFKLEPISITYVDARTLVLRFDSIDYSKSYQIRFMTIDDYSGAYSRTAAEGGNTAAVRQGR